MKIRDGTWGDTRRNMVYEWGLSLGNAVSSNYEDEDVFLIFYKTRNKKLWRETDHKPT